MSSITADGRIYVGFEDVSEHTLMTCAICNRVSHLFTFKEEYVGSTVCREENQEAQRSLLDVHRHVHQSSTTVVGIIFFLEIRNTSSEHFCTLLRDPHSRAGIIS